MYSSSMLAYQSRAAKTEIPGPVLALKVPNNRGCVVVSQHRADQHPVALLRNLPTEAAETEVRMEGRVAAGALDVLVSD